mmetsp:Transcript_50374/g.90578  ORF Transcript_50374/g.90578 Transcript_50374/m.90578 type:complete len:144 (-) Transcript_50374:108-539(-)
MSGPMRGESSVESRGRATLEEVLRELASVQTDLAKERAANQALRQAKQCVEDSHRRDVDMLEKMLSEAFKENGQLRQRLKEAGLSPLSDGRDGLGDSELKSTCSDASASQVDSSGCQSWTGQLPGSKSFMEPAADILYRTLGH